MCVCIYVYILLSFLFYRKRLTVHDSLEHAWLTVNIMAALFRLYIEVVIS